MGLAKSNVYTYFESREHVLLELTYQEWSGWLGEAELALLDPKLRGRAAAVARALAESFLARPRLAKLAAVVATVLERNVSEEAIASFKLRGLSLGIRAGAMLHAALPALPLETCQRLLTPTFALVAGLWPMCHPPPAVARVLEREEFAPHRKDFATELAFALELLLRGALAADHG